MRDHGLRRGPARELTELAAKCRKAIAGKISIKDWTTVWAAQPERIKALWKPALVETAEGRTIDRGKLALGFEAEGIAMIAPKPEIVQPAIEDHGNTKREEAYAQ